MLPKYLVEETTVRAAGETAPIEIRHRADGDVLLTLGITHAMDQQSLTVELFESSDGRDWQPCPCAKFSSKYYCGTYQLLLPASDARFVKAAWRPQRWSREDQRPYFRFYLKAEASRRPALAAVAC